MRFTNFLMSLKQSLATSRTRQFRKRRSSSSPAVTGIECLEDRQLLTTMLYLDFGAGFSAPFGGPGNMQTTVSELANVDGSGPNGFGTGPDLTNSSLSNPMNSTDQLTFQPVVWDYSGDGLFTVADINQLAGAVQDKVEEMLAPFDINVAIASASSLDDMSATLSANDTMFNQTGQNDVYSIVTVATSIDLGAPFPALANSVSTSINLAGIAAAEDLWGAAGNLNDEVTLTFSDSLSAFVTNAGAVQGTTAGNDAFVKALSSVIVHEAMHTFGVVHVADPSPSETLVLGNEFINPTINVLNDLFVTRFPMSIEDSDMGLQNPYDVLANDPDIGLVDKNFNGVPDFAYVTGTGAHDQISIVETSDGNISVSVAAYSDTTHLNLIRSFSYSLTPGVDTEQGIQILAGPGWDVVTVYASVDLPVEIHGNTGNDILTGGSGSDLLVGGTGDDILTGGMGADQLLGGLGDDSLIQFSNFSQQKLTDTQVTGTGTDTHQDIEEFELQGGAGNNTIDASQFTLGSVTIMGGQGNDVLKGGTQSDSLLGGSGNDTLYGNGGKDHLWGGDDLDKLWGGDLGDILDGGDHDDELYGEGGDDTLYGWQGNDTLHGHDGIDELFGGSGHDVLWGGAKDDYLVGDSGNDKLYGGTGDDQLWGSDGNDTLAGGFDDDYLNGGDDNDKLDGQIGIDTLKGGDGDDELKGGQGSYTDWLYGGNGNDLLDGQKGNDKLVGNDGNDTLLGGDGHDWLYGDDDHPFDGDGKYETGNDLILGGFGSDKIYGGPGNDTLLGESGNDTLKAGRGSDVLFGGSGSDSLVGLHGSNVLFATRDDRLAVGRLDHVIEVDLPLPATRTR